MTTGTASADYQRGYRAGRRHAEEAEAKRERVYMQALEMVLKHCSGWQIGEKPITNAEGYCRLARIFTDHAIDEMKR